MWDAHWLTPGEKNGSRNFSLENELKTPRGDGPSQTSVRREHPVEKVSTFQLASCSIYVEGKVKNPEESTE